MKTYRGFESLPHRQIRKKAQVKYLGFFAAYTSDAGRVRPPKAARRVSAANPSLPFLQTLVQMMLRNREHFVIRFLVAQHGAIRNDKEFQA
ncbi:hypothetical protein C5469_02235 [Photorhabdus cinerea]|uniref:Uncharacterized protein n=1 Tax=Photorhabdus cinerea TaxID=471575 RepID=A0A7X5QB15_9GAMM|nr:hypothetical protein [Photorhabdus cinerea]